MNTCRTSPDPVGLAIASEMQERLKPAQVILQGSRAAGDHRPDSDVDLMAVCPDYATLLRVEGILREFLKGDYTPPVVNVITITGEEFRNAAPLAQSPAGQASRQGVTPDDRSLDDQPERDPEPEEIRQEAIPWLILAEIHLETFSGMVHRWEASTHISALEAQTALERAVKGLLTASNGPARFRRDAAQMWCHFEETGPIRDRGGAIAMEALLATTRGSDGRSCTLTRFTEAYRRGHVVPDPTEQERVALSRFLAPAVNGLIDEALSRSGATREDLRRERDRRHYQGQHPGERTIP